MDGNFSWPMAATCTPSIYCRAPAAWCARAWSWGDGCFNATAWRLGPDTGSATPLPWLDRITAGGWSPDGSRMVYTAAHSIATVAHEDGSSPLRLLPFDVAVAPQGATAAYLEQR